MRNKGRGGRGGDDSSAFGVEGGTSSVTDLEGDVTGVGRGVGSEGRGEDWEGVEGEGGRGGSVTVKMSPLSTIM
jgi:hypothetical protein